VGPYSIPSGDRLFPRSSDVSIIALFCQSFLEFAFELEVFLSPLIMPLSQETALCKELLHHPDERVSANLIRIIQRGAITSLQAYVPEQRVEPTQGNLCRGENQGVESMPRITPEGPTNRVGCILLSLRGLRAFSIPLRPAIRILTQSLTSWHGLLHSSESIVADVEGSMKRPMYIGDCDQRK
jgi:hypothetical protein